MTCNIDDLEHIQLSDKLKTRFIESRCRVLPHAYIFEDQTGYYCVLSEFNIEPGLYKFVGPVKVKQMSINVAINYNVSLMKRRVDLLQGFHTKDIKLVNKRK